MNDAGQHLEELSAWSNSIMAECGNARRPRTGIAQTCPELQVDTWPAPTVLDKAAVSSGMETISLSPSFFENELKAYSDWREAFWRELVQNSVDAGCRNIDIHSCHNEDFAATLTELFGKVSAHAKLVRAALRACKSAGIRGENRFSEAA